MLTVTSGREKVDIYLSKSEEFETFCFNQFIISFQINDLHPIGNSVKVLELQLEEVYIIWNVTIGAGEISFYCEPNNINTFNSVLDLESTVIRQINEIKEELLGFIVPYEIQLIVDGFYE